MPTLGEITRKSGVAGQLAYTVLVTYPGEAARAVTFVGSVYGGPVVMVTGRFGFNSQVFVDDPRRFGDFGPEWVRRFFADRELRGTAQRQAQPRCTPRRG